MIKKYIYVTLTLACLCVSNVIGADWSLTSISDGNNMIAEYFRTEMKKLSDGYLTDIKTLEDWQAKREIYRKQLYEMLGLEPLPEKTNLKAVTTGRVEHKKFVVEKIHFQSRPGLYVTGNLYIPNDVNEPAPAILYVCGHRRVKKDGISYGNKAAYQHHSAWFARHGYVCLIIDSLQLGEIEGIHHGTYNHKMWWWNSRGYTPAGVEAWNCIRALDYLQTRPEVDKDRIGVTGRSGGGAYSWWIVALDERIKAAVPVAGITDLQNHVLDGCVEGHCDCMYFVNTYRWDYPLLAALVAPKPLLISNSDKDGIFPLDGVVRLHKKVSHIYSLYGAVNKLGLNITEGPHKDTQEMRVHAFVWFNRFLKGENPLIDEPAVKLFEPERLGVFDELPVDQLNSQIHESFTTKASQPSIPQSADEWSNYQRDWMDALCEKSFRGWPTNKEAGPLKVQKIFSVERNGICFSGFDFTSQPYVRLRLYLMHQADPNRAEIVILNVQDESDWTDWLAAVRVSFAGELIAHKLPEPNESAFKDYQQMLKNTRWIMAYVAPRGIGPTAFGVDERKHTQIRRRFMLLGQTLDGMRVWDVRRAIQSLRAIESTSCMSVWLKGKEQMAGIVLYASLFEPNIEGLELVNMPDSHRIGPTFLNVLRFMDIPQAVAMAAERSKVRIYKKSTDGWQFPLDVADKLSWPKGQIQILKAPEAENE